MYLKIKDGMEVAGKNGIVFRTTDGVDFANEVDREIDVYERDTNTGEPILYLITKKVKAISANRVSKTIGPVVDIEYPTITINDTNVIEITSVVDDLGNKYYEVPYLAQESIFVEKPNTQANSESYATSSIVPYVLEVQKVEIK